MTTRRQFLVSVPAAAAAFALADHFVLHVDPARAQQIDLHWLTRAPLPRGRNVARGRAL